MLAVHIRLATVDDAAALAIVHVRTWQVAYRGQVPQDYLDALDPAQRRQMWEQWLRDADPLTSTLALRDAAGAVIGFVTVSGSRDPDADPQVMGEVKAIYVLPERWGEGGGRLLMEAGLRKLADAGFHAATLWVLEANRQARRFYEAGGWRPDGAAKTDEIRGFPLVEVRYRVAWPVLRPSGG